MIRRLGVLVAAVCLLGVAGVVPAAAAGDSDTGFPPGATVYTNGLYGALVDPTGKPGVTFPAWVANWDESPVPSAGWIRPAAAPTSAGEATEPL